jgi:hypothetical protein
MRAIVTTTAEEEISHLAAVNGWTETPDVHERRKRWRRWQHGDLQVRVCFTPSGHILEAHTRGGDGEWVATRFPKRAALNRFLIAAGGAR